MSAAAAWLRGFYEGCEFIKGMHEAAIERAQRRVSGASSHRALVVAKGEFDALWDNRGAPSGGYGDTEDVEPEGTSSGDDGGPT